MSIIFNCKNSIVLIVFLHFIMNLDIIVVRVKNIPFCEHFMRMVFNLVTSLPEHCGTEDSSHGYGTSTLVSAVANI
jgi:hypothetical protein